MAFGAVLSPVPAQSIWLWIGFIILILVLLTLDLGLFHKKKHTPSVKEALVWTGVWISLAMLFNVFIWYKFGSQSGLEFFTGYLIEKSLSVDNLFVILLIFSSFKVDPRYQHKLLFFGILGALVLRGAFILLGTTLISRFEWILGIFGLFLIYSGMMIYLKKKGKEDDPRKGWIFKIIQNVMPIAKKDKESSLFCIENGKIVVTSLFIALVIVEVSDILFAFDSIPAIFGVTLNPFIVFTSNIFAILGLRSLYFVLLGARNKFKYLDMALAVILIFIGIKMLISCFVDISIITSLLLILDIMIFYIIASVYILPKKTRKKDKVGIRKMPKES